MTVDEAFNELDSQLKAGESHLCRCIEDLKDRTSSDFIHLMLAKQGIKSSLEHLQSIRQNLLEQPEQSRFSKIKYNIGRIEEILIKEIKPNLLNAQHNPIKGWAESFLNTISKLLCCFGEYKSNSTIQTENRNDDLKRVSEELSLITSSAINQYAFFNEERNQPRAENEETQHQESIQSSI